MTQRTIDILINGKNSRILGKNFINNKTDVYHFDDIWSLDILDITYYGLGKQRGFIYVLVVIDNLLKFGWTIAIRNKKLISLTNFFESIPTKYFRRRPSLSESADRSEFVNKTFLIIQITITIKIILKTPLQVLFLQNVLIVPSEISLASLSLKKVKPIG